MNHRAPQLAGLFALITSLLGFGCTSVRHCDEPEHPVRGPKPSPALKTNYVLEVNNQGFLLDLRPGKKRHPITSREGLADYLRTNVFAGFAHSRKSKILLFVHGGLNDRSTGMSHFWNDYEDIMRQSDYYPIFVVWPSGWTSTYFEHLFWVRQGIRAETGREKTFSLLTSPFVLIADLGRAITRLPVVIANNSKSDIEIITPIRERDGGAAVQQYQDLVRTNFQVAIGDDYSRLSDRALRDTTYWLTLPIKYVLSSFIDGFGKGAWDNMLRRTQQTYPARLDVPPGTWFRPSSRTNTTNPRPPSRAYATWRTFSKREEKVAERYDAAGLPVFVEMLRRYQMRNPNLEVTLVGHSMGTIILNRVVRDAEMQFNNIVYMGAACTIADFSTSVLPYMKKHPDTQFYNLSLHPVAEAGEWQAAMADLPPRGSLLVWIDNFLQNPVTEQERTFGRWRNLYRSSATGEPIIRQFYDNEGTNRLKERLHFQAFSVGYGNHDQLRKIKYQWNEHPVPKDEKERCDNPMTHGQLSEMPYWKPSFWWMPTIVSGGKARQVAGDSPPVQPIREP
jgi:pimeloyl-ACP methyl ester carboxylesterase